MGESEYSVMVGKYQARGKEIHDLRTQLATRTEELAEAIEDKWVSDTAYKGASVERDEAKSQLAEQGREIERLREVREVRLWAEGLILQLPEGHDGRNSWLLNYGNPESGVVKRLRRTWERRAGRKGDWSGGAIAHPEPPATEGGSRDEE